MITHTIESYWIPSHIGSQVKRWQSQSYKFKEFAKISNFWILKQTFHATHFLKLLDKMCKYEMDPMSIVEDTERTRFCPQTDKVKPVYTPFNFVEAGGIIKCHHHHHQLTSDVRRIPSDLPLIHKLMLQWWITTPQFSHCTCFLLTESMASCCAVFGCWPGWLGCPCWGWFGSCGESPPAGLPRITIVMFVWTQRTSGPTSKFTCQGH